MLFVSAIGILSVNAQEKAKPDFKKVAEKAQAAVDAELKISNGGSKLVATAKGDSLIVGDSAKYVVIKDRVYPVSAFTQSAPIFLPADAWLAVLEIINTRKYGDIPVTTISQIIQAIGQQIPQKGGGQ